MEFLKAFVLDGTEHKLNILWENDEPLFRANEVGKVLGIVNIRTSIKSFDDTEKVVHPMYTLGGEQETTFLTETGLYRLSTGRHCQRPHPQGLHLAVRRHRLKALK